MRLIMTKRKEWEYPVLFEISRSKLYQNDDDDFWLEKNDGESEENYKKRIDDTRYEYYRWEFWYDCDYLKIKWLWTFNRCEVDWEILVDEYWVDMGWDVIYLEDLWAEKKLLIARILNHYMWENWEQWSIAPDFDRWDWNAQLQNWDEMDIIVKYRWWKGYTHAFCWYKKEQFYKLNNLQKWKITDE